MKYEYTERLTATQRFIVKNVVILTLTEITAIGVDTSLTAS